MLQGIGILLVLQLTGEVVSGLLSLPVPGPVMGMILLFAWLCWRGRVPQSLDTVARGLLARLSLLYVPAGVGIIQYLADLRSDGVAIAVAVVASTVLAIIVTGLALQWLLRRPAPQDAP
ncbi:holin-like protein [Pontibaca methylaminivorans]|uniref:Holin-like protein n=2 Tax=Pontibaca methylaminivorans TaxID=515897 RepID=A0A1R3X750_9RHOB|nr:holin-like protein [Pontibaca methylaminivorans]